MRHRQLRCSLQRRNGQDLVDGLDQKIGVLKVSQSKQIEDDACDQNSLCQEWSCWLDRSNGHAEPIVEQGQSAKHQAIQRKPAHVKVSTCHQKQWRPKTMGQAPKSEHYDRQKQQVADAIKKH